MFVLSVHVGLVRKIFHRHLILVDSKLSRLVDLISLYILIGSFILMKFGYRLSVLWIQIFGTRNTRYFADSLYFVNLYCWKTVRIIVLRSDTISHSCLSSLCCLFEISQK